jgi:hypothetical protein
MKEIHDNDTSRRQRNKYQFSIVSKLLSALVPRATPVRKRHPGNNFLPQDAPGSCISNIRGTPPATITKPKYTQLTTEPAQLRLQLDD